MKRLAAALDRARSRRSRIGKEEAIAEALASIASDGDSAALAVAARIASGRVLPVGDGRALGVGWSLLLDVVRGATGLDDEILVACARKTGDLGEAFGLLMRRVDGAAEREGVPLRDVATLAVALAGEPGRAAKRALLDAAFARATPIETKYLSKAIGGGLRIGAQEGVVEGAIARAFGAPLDRVRRAGALVTDLGDVAVLAHARRLDEARLEVGRPVAFMLATPLETIASPIDPAAYMLEDKIDGVRAQAHRLPDGTVALFARGLDRVTDAFPEVTSALRAAPSAAVLDGEIVAVGPSGRPRPFQALQPRLKKTRPSAADIAADPRGARRIRPPRRRRRLPARPPAQRSDARVLRRCWRRSATPTPSCSTPPLRSHPRARGRGPHLLPRCLLGSAGRCPRRRVRGGARPRARGARPQADRRALRRGTTGPGVDQGQARARDARRRGRRRRGGPRPARGRSSATTRSRSGGTTSSCPSARPTAG